MCGKGLKLGQQNGIRSAIFCRGKSRQFGNRSQAGIVAFRSAKVALLSRRGCEKMGTGSAPGQANPVKMASSEVPVPIFSQPRSERRLTLRNCLQISSGP